MLLAVAYTLVAGHPQTSPESTAEVCIEALFEEAESNLRARPTQLKVGLRYLEGDCAVLLLAWAEGTEGPVGAEALVVDYQATAGRIAGLRIARQSSTQKEECAEVRSMTVLSTASLQKAIRRSLSALNSLQLSPILPPVLIVDGGSYKLWISSGPSESSFTFEVPAGNSAGASRHVLDRWSRDLLTVLGVSCPLAATVSRDPLRPSENQ
jgi:hypothetical protein